MNECFDYQVSPRLDMVFNTYIKEIIIFIYLFIIFFKEN